MVESRNTVEHPLPGERNGAGAEHALREPRVRPLGLVAVPSSRPRRRVRLGQYARPERSTRNLPKAPGHSSRKRGDSRLMTMGDDAP